MKMCVKWMANAFAIVLLVPLWGPYLLLPSRFRDAVFPGISQVMSLFPGLLGQYLRRGLYRMILPRCGADCCVGFGTLIVHVEASIGRAAYLGPYCVIGEVEIGDDALIGSQVSIMNGSRQHGIERLDIPVREQPGEWPRITIGEDTWVGDRAIIMADVGKHCVVGAGAVVTKPVEDYQIVVGNPARVIGDRRELASTRPSGTART